MLVPGAHSNKNLKVNIILTLISIRKAGDVFSYKLRYSVGFWLVEMAISTNQKPAIYRTLYRNTGPGSAVIFSIVNMRKLR